MSGIGDVMAELRNERNLTQQELAIRADVSLEWVRSLEQGRVKSPRMASVIRVADVLGVDPMELAVGRAAKVPQGTGQALSAGQIQSINASLVTMQSLSPRRLAEVQRMIELFAELDEEDFKR